MGALCELKSSHLLFYVSHMQYKADESVKLWVNKVGPYNNPQETYNYYSLPFCQPSDNPAHKWGGLGEVLGGNELIDSQLDIKFLSTTMLFSYYHCLYLLFTIYWMTGMSLDRCFSVSMPFLVLLIV